MRFHSHTWLAITLLFSISCQSSHEDMKKEFDQLKSGNNDRYSVAFAYATYLSTTRALEPGEAIPMINELISMGYPTVARYCIDNLKGNGIHSYNLLALHGLCYQLEFQPELAIKDMESALQGDPGNEKIMTLLQNARSGESQGTEQSTHEALFRRGFARLQREQYDSAMVYMKGAFDMEADSRYEQFITQITRIMEGDKMIESDPMALGGYLQKAKALASMKVFDNAQKTLDQGLGENPDNQNLILAKALVWVQEGDHETARQYLWEQEQRGIVIDPAVKQKILQQ